MASKFKSDDENQNKNRIFEETKMVLELMEESKERVSNLNITLKKLEGNKMKLENVGFELKTSIVRSNALIKSNSDFKVDMKSCNESFLRMAQYAYNQCKALSADLQICNDKHDNILKALNDGEGKFANEKKEFESKNNNYLVQMAEIDRLTQYSQNNLMEKSKKCSELELLLGELRKENTMEEQIISDKILNKNHNLEEAKNLKDAEKNYDEAIAALKAIEDDKDTVEKTIKVDLEELDQKIMDMETEISELNYEGNLNTLNEVITGTKELELTINNLSNDIVELTKKKENVTQSLMDDKTTNELKAEEMKFVIEDRTKALTYQLNITAELQADIANQDTKMHCLETEITCIDTYISNINEKPKLDQQEQITRKESFLCELRTNRDKLKEDIRNKQKDIATESDALKKVIEDLQLELRKRQAEYDQGEQELKKLTVMKDGLSKEIPNKKVIVEERMQKLESMKNKLAGMKEKQAVKEKVPMDFPHEPRRLAKTKAASSSNIKQVKGNSSTSANSANIRSFWESDSSIEAIDLAAKLRKKKMRKTE